MSSTGGSVFGSATSVVTPPAAAALAAAFDRLHVLGAGLAQLHAHIDEAGRQAQPGEIDDLGLASGLRAIPGPSAAMRSPSTSRSPCWSSPLSGSSSRALR